MRTALFLLAGLMLLAVCFILAKQFSSHYAAAVSCATVAFILLWLAVAAFNMWVGVSKAGYSVAEELPVMLLIFGVPAAVALVLKWKFL